MDTKLSPAQTLTQSEGHSVQTRINSPSIEVASPIVGTEAQPSKDSCGAIDVAGIFVARMKFKALLT